MTNKLHGIIFAYRSNPQLRELSQPRNTCSIPYGGRYRVVDFMLSNMVNAGISDVIPDKYTAALKNLFVKHANDGIKNGLSNEEIVANFQNEARDQYPEIEGL